jgi:hypothetical protein
MIERDKSGKIMIDFSKDENPDLPIRVLDERYTYSDFKYAVNVNFKSLQNAVNAENFIMNKYNNLVRNLADGIVMDPNMASEFKNLTTAEQFFTNLTNLINLNEDSVVSQKEKVRQLEQTVEDVRSESQEKETLLYSQANEIMEKDMLIKEKDREIELLKESINSLLTSTNI